MHITSRPPVPRRCARGLLGLLNWSRNTPSPLASIASTSFLASCVSRSTAMTCVCECARAYLHKCVCTCAHVSASGW